MPEERPAGRGGGVDALLQHGEVDAALVEPGRQVQQVLVVTADAAQPGDHDLVPGGQPAQQLIQPGAGGQLAGDLIDHDVARLDPGHGQRVLLGVRVLLAGGDLRIPVPGHRGAPGPPGSAVMSLLIFRIPVYRTLNKGQYSRTHASGRVGRGLLNLRSHVHGSSAGLDMLRGRRPRAVRGLAGSGISPWAGRPPGDTSARTGCGGRRAAAAHDPPSGTDGSWCLISGSARA